MRYQVLIGRPGPAEYVSGDVTIAVDAPSDVDAGYQAALVLAGQSIAGRQRPLAVIRTWQVKSVQCEDGDPVPVRKGYAVTVTRPLIRTLRRCGTNHQGECTSEPPCTTKGG
jgi:hypothetical protein